MDRLPSTSSFTMVSKKGMDPSSLLSSTVNFMAGSTLFLCCRKPCLLASLWMTKVSSTYLHQNLGGGVQCLGLFALSTPYSSQASLGDSSLSPAESELSQAGSSQASPEECTLSLAESEFSQANSPQASPADSTLSPAESEVSQQAVPRLPQKIALFHWQRVSSPRQVPPLPWRTALFRQRVLFLPRQSGAWQGLGLGRQVPPREVSMVSQWDSTVPQRIFPQDNASQEAGSFPSRHNTLQGSSTSEEPNPKWVNNLSSKPLTPAQRSVLAKGHTFVVTPRHPPNLEYITAIEAACTKLSQQDAEELRVDINLVLRSSHPPKPNLTKTQNSAIRELNPYHAKGYLQLVANYAKCDYSCN